MPNCNLTIKNKYIVLPVNMNAKRKKICFYEGENLVWDFDACLDFISPRFYTYLNVSHLRGKTLTVKSSPDIDMSFTFVDIIPSVRYYKEEYRPLSHFSPKIGWMNDPNGLVYADGVYHMFWQHNPTDTRWGNMTWGHTVSSDLIHWSECDSALQPDEMGTMFSGSAIVDKNNITGLKNGKNDPILLYYTAAGDNSAISAGKKFAQCMAYSTDGGKTFEKYENNPIIEHIVGGNRDPKIIWCDELGCYVLALYLDGDVYALFTTNDFINFTELQRISLKGDDECPDFYPLTVENEESSRKWVLSGASDMYLVGEIKNGKFEAVQESKAYFYGHRTSYAAQTFSDMPNGRRVKMAWQIVHAPESPFENQMSIPTEVSLAKLGGMYRLRTLPVHEFESLRTNSESYTVNADGTFCRPLHRKAYDIEISAERDCPDFAVRFFGYEIRIRTSNNTVSYNDVEMPLSYTGNGVKLRLVSDVLGVEIFADDGLVYSMMPGVADYGIRYLRVVPLTKENLMSVDVTVHTLNTIW